MRASKHASEIDFKVIFVSPLRRTLETAYYTFKDHPNFKKMRVIISPLIREKIGITGDVPLPNLELRQQLDQVYKPMFGGQLDTS